ncbi:CHAT domain-containing protein [Streptomyces yangpuensis]|uniref:CHAT domain-containing protein n=1 Tax=Streptomyces yangpuensis TaxID=1648182 RepID=UPI003802F92C
MSPDSAPVSASESGGPERAEIRSGLGATDVDLAPAAAGAEADEAGEALVPTGAVPQSGAEGTSSTFRLVVAGSLEPEHARPIVALTLAEDIERLLAADWDTRRLMLAEQPRLLHPRVAAACAPRDPFLSLVIDRAAEAGLERALAELPVGASLQACLDAPEPPPLEHAEAATRPATGPMTDHGARWLARLTVELAERLTAEPDEPDEPGETEEPEESEEPGEPEETVSVAGSPGLRQDVLTALAVLFDVDRACLDEAGRLTETDWEEVGAELADLPADPLELARAAEVWVQYLALFAPQAPEAGWAADLRDLLRATAHRGPDRAVEEHRLVLAAQSACRDEDHGAAEWLAGAADTANTLLGHWSRHGADWVLVHAVVLARTVVSATPADHAERADLVADLGSAIAEQVQAGLAPVRDLEESLAHAYEAVRLTPSEAPGWGTFAANLGYRIGLAVDAGLRPAAALRDAVQWQRRALDAAPAPDERRPLRASMLASRISEAVRAGEGTSADLQEAIVHAEEAVTLSAKATATASTEATNGDSTDSVEAHARSGTSDRAMFEINLALLLTEAVEAGARTAHDLPRAVALARCALDRIPPWHTDRPGYLASAATVLGDAVNADAVATETLEEALAWQRESVDGTSEDHPHYASRLSGLSNRIAHAVLAGLRPAAGYAEAVRLARLALEHTPPGHPDRPSFASNLGAVVEEAVQFGALPDTAMDEAREAAREAYDSAPESAPARVGYASNLATLLAAGRRAEDYDEALALARYCVAHVPEGHPARPTHLSNLSSLIADLVREGVVEPNDLAKALTEAIRTGEHALAGTSEANPRRAAHESNLATALGLAVRRGVAPPERLTDVLRLATAAADRTPASHPDRAVYLTNLMLALEEAVKADVLTGRQAADRALTVITDFRQLVLYTVSSPVQREAVLRTCEGLVAVATPLVADGAGAAEGIRVAEGVRNLAVGADRIPDLPAGAVPPELSARHRAAVEAHRSAQQRFGAGLEDLAGTAGPQEELAAVLAEIHRSLPGDGPPRPGDLPTLADLAAHLPEASTAVYLVPGAEATDGRALLLDRAGAVRQIPLPGLSEEQVGGWVNRLLEGPHHALAVQGLLWQVAMEPLLRAVDTTHVEAGGTTHVEAGGTTHVEAGGTADWILVPVGHLSMLPVHAAGTPEEWFDDRVAVRVVPSLTQLAPPAAPPASGAPLVATSRAADLPFLPADRAVAEHLLPSATGPGTVVRARTRGEALTGLAEAPSAVLGGHARHSLRHGAGLDLDDGPVAAEHLWRLPVRDRDVAFVTGCSSAQVAGTLVDEVVGLPSALLRAGFRGVFATLWPVSDATAFITLAHLLQLRRARPDLAPHLVLHQVRRTLRTLTTRELRRWFEELDSHLPVPPDTTARLEAFLAPYGGGATPLADPKDWAAFAYVGR